MKHLQIMIAVLVAFAPVSTNALGKKISSDFSNASEQSLYDNTGAIPMTDPQYEWSQSANKLGGAIITQTGLELTCNSAVFIATSVSEMSFNPEADDFVFASTFIGPKLKDNLTVGILFDYEDSRNYKGIGITNTQYYYFVVKDGTAANVKTGLVKYKDNTYKLKIDRKGEKILFSLNDIEFAKFNRIKISSPYLGVFLQGKGKSLIPHFQFSITTQDDDVEQSTSDM